MSNTYSAFSLLVSANIQLSLTRHPSSIISSYISDINVKINQLKLTYDETMYMMYMKTKHVPGIKISN